MSDIDLIYLHLGFKNEKMFVSYILILRLDGIENTA
jgi:hypothetical protein